MFQQTLAGSQNRFSVGPVSAALARLLAAVVPGGAIGLGREWRGKPAGLRTHIFVCVATCLFVIPGRGLNQLDFRQHDQPRHDPLRKIKAVTAGIAFLAARLIPTSKGKVRNATTGGPLWLAGAVDLGCGAGQLPFVAPATGIIVGVIFLLRQVERIVGIR